MEASGLRPSSWTDGIQVEERQLQEYLHQKQHAVLLKGAAKELAHTLRPAPTTDAEDRLVHFGDALMLRSDATGGLLQADVASSLSVPSGSQGSTSSCAPLSTGCTVSACPRNVFTVCRGEDGDGFGEDPTLHFGQAIRLSTGGLLQDRPLYLYACAAGTLLQDQQNEVINEGETAACLHPRASAGTLWEVLPAEDALVRGKRRTAPPAKGSPVPLGARLVLGSLSSSRSLRSDSTLRMTQYGNEYRVYGGEPASSSTSSSAAAWSFVDMRWADGEVEKARSSGAGGSALAFSGDVDAHDPVRLLLEDPVFRAEHNLRELASQGGGKQRYAVIERLFPLMRSAGMHEARQLRRMCADADLDGQGNLPLSIFQGLLSGMGLRLKDKTEADQIITLFGVDGDPGAVDYLRFFALLAPSMSSVRLEAVQDAFEKLKKLDPAGVVEISTMQKKWNPRCHPQVQSGELAPQEALQDFLRQWDVSSADGSISFREFSEYYQDVSMATERDQDFIEIVRHGWGL